MMTLSEVCVCICTCVYNIAYTLALVVVGYQCDGMRVVYAFRVAPSIHQ